MKPLNTYEIYLVTGGNKRFTFALLKPLIWICLGAYLVLHGIIWFLLLEGKTHSFEIAVIAAGAVSICVGVYSIIRLGLGRRSFHKGTLKPVAHPRIGDMVGQESARMIINDNYYSLIARCVALIVIGIVIAAAPMFFLNMEKELFDWFLYCFPGLGLIVLGIYDIFKYKETNRLYRARRLSIPDELKHKK